MIIPNGYIQYVLTENEGGIDANTGYAIENSSTLSQYVPVQFNPLRFNYLSKENGEPVTKQGYAIFIEYSSGAVQSERIHLYRSDMTEVGEFSVISITPLDAVCQYKLTV